MFAKRWIHLVFLWLLLSVSLPARAAGDAAELQALQDNAYGAVSQMMMYVVLERAPERKGAADARLKAADAAVARLADATLSQKWQAVRAAVVTDPYTGGEVNPYAIYAMENEVTTFAGEIATRMPSSLSPSRKVLYELVGLLQGMTTIYLRNNADPRGGSGYVGVNHEVDLAVQQQQFSAKMSSLAKADPKLAQAMTKAAAKWRFLASYFANYNSQSVPYAVDLYGRQISTDLLALGAAQP